MNSYHVTSMEQPENGSESGLSLRVERREGGRPEKAAHSPSLFASSNFTDADLVRRLAHKEIENTGEGKRLVHARIEPPRRLADLVL